MNIAFIDGQNLHLGTRSNNWKVDVYKLRTYLRDKYNITEAYYFLGFLNEDNQDLYNDLQKAGFIITFREHNKTMSSQKKGNVDTDIIFEMMRTYIDNKNFEKILLISGDGEKIGDIYFATLDHPVTKGKIKYIK